MLDFMCYTKELPPALTPQLGDMIFCVIELPHTNELMQFGRVRHYYVWDLSAHT